MLIVLDSVLTPEEFIAVRQAVDHAQYVAGTVSAGSGSRTRKHNLQISEQDRVHSNSGMSPNPGERDATSARSGSLLGSAVDGSKELISGRV